MSATVDVSPLERLTAVVDALAAEAIDEHSTHALGDDLATLRREIDRLEAQFIRRLGPFDRNQGAEGENSPNTISWLRGTCGLTTAAAVDRVRMARTLEALPMVSASFASGQTPFANASLVSHLADTVGSEPTRGVEATLAPAAETLDPGKMFRLTELTRHQLDAEGVLAADNRNYERRWFSCDRAFGGAFVLRGQLDTEGGALVKTALEAMSQRHGPDDERTGSQRSADALVDMASAMLQKGDLPSVHGVRPHLVLTGSLDAFRGVPGVPPVELQGIGPVHAETARRLACDASVRVAVEVASDGNGGAGVDLDAGADADAVLVAAPAPGARAGDRSFSIGRESRKPPAPMRTAIALRDQGCRFPRCDRPVAWTSAHHMAHWTADGETKVPNLVLLCRYHHRVVHEQGRDIRLLDDGTVDVSERGVKAPHPGFHRRE